MKISIARIAAVVYCMILISSTPYRDHDMPDENMHSSVGGMTCDHVQVSSTEAFLCFATLFSTSNTILIRP